MASFIEALLSFQLERITAPPLADVFEWDSAKIEEDSPDVLAALRATGKGWQTRIDAVLREAVQAGRVSFASDTWTLSCKRKHAS